MSDVRKGVDVLIFVNTGTEAAPVWTPVGGQRNATLSESAEPIELSHKLSQAREFEPGIPTWTISCDGVIVVDDAALQALRRAVRQRQKVLVRVQEGGTYTAEGRAVVQGLDMETPWQEEATYSVELQGSGPLTQNPAP